MSLLSCTHCSGFIPSNLGACPHCGTNIKHSASALKKAAALALGGLSMMSLMACYGIGPESECFDQDGDDFTDCEGDCNDSDASVYPGADDPAGDDIDQDCDGVDGEGGSGGAGGAGGTGGAGGGTGAAGGGTGAAGGAGGAGGTGGAGG